MERTTLEKCSNITISCKIYHPTHTSTPPMETTTCHLQNEENKQQNRKRKMMFFGFFIFFIFGLIVNCCLNNIYVS